MDPPDERASVGGDGALDTELDARLDTEPDARLDIGLETELRSLAQHVDFPPTPDLAQAVRSRLEAEVVGDYPAPAPAARAPGGPAPVPSAWSADDATAPTPIDRARPWRYRIRRSTLFAVAALLVLAGVVVAVTYALGGWRLSFVEQLPPSRPTATVPAAASVGGATATPSSRTLVPTAPPVGSTLGLGELIPPGAAATGVDYPPLAPPALSELGSPDAVYVDRVPTGGMVSYVYAPRPGYPETSQGSGVGLIVTQFRGDLRRGEYFQKLATSGTTVTRTLVRGGNAYYLSGALHAFLYRPPDGREAAEERFRLVGNALIWERGPLTVRLEGALTLEQARVVAGSID